jgi:hypothetical protein
MWRALVALAGAAAIAGSASARSGVPEAGTYLFDASGTDRETTGASERLPAQAAYVVAPTAAGYTATLRIGRRHLEASRFRVDTDGAWEVSRRTEIGRAAAAQPQTRLRPSPLHIPQVLTVGASWPFDYRLRGSRERGSGRVLRTERVTVAGRPVDVSVIILRTTMTEAAPGSRREVIWWDSSRSLPVRVVLSARRGGAHGYETRLRLDLRALAPV